MTKLILGTVQFGLKYGINNSIGKPNFESIKQILDFAFENNVNELDTADAYGDSQKVLNEYLKKSSKKFSIMSKFIWDKNHDFDYHIDKSLTELSQNSLNGYYFHRFEDFKEFPFFDQVRKNKLNNKLNFLGVSLYSLEELEFAVNHPEVNLIQLPFNLLDRSKEKQELLKKAHDKNIKIYIRSVFLQGLFFKNYEQLPQNLLPLKNSLKKLNDLSKENNLSIEELALSYVNSKEFIDGILIGVDSLEQLKKNIKYTGNILSEELVKKVESIEFLNDSLLNPINWK